MSDLTERTVQSIREKWDPQFELIESRFVPWAHLPRPLNRCKIGLISTAGVYLKDGFHQPFDTENPLGDPSFREMPSTVDLADLRIGHTHYDDRYAREDLNVVFPVDRLLDMARLGVIGQVAPLIYSFMGHVTRPVELLTESVPNLMQRLRRMQADAVLVVAVSPICHQTAGLIARSLEAAGLPTLAAGVYPELWAAVKPPRAVWSQFPAGATFGQPGNVGKQQAVMQEALDRLELMQIPGSVHQLSYAWGRE